MEWVAFSRTLDLLDFEGKLKVWSNVNQRDGDEKIKKGTCRRWQGLIQNIMHHAVVQCRTISAYQSCFSVGSR